MAAMNHLVCDPGEMPCPAGFTTDPDKEGRRCPTKAQLSLSNDYLSLQEPLMTDSTMTPRKRGFALLGAEKMKEVAALGGRTAHASGRAHQFTREEARAAARRSVEGRTRRAAEARSPTPASEGPST